MIHRQLDLAVFVLPIQGIGRGHLRQHRIHRALCYDYTMCTAKAQELIAARSEYVAGAKKEAQEVLRQAELDARTIVSESETLQLARQKSSEIIRRAEDRSKELYHVANTYTEDALRRTEEAIQAALTEVQESRARFRAASKEQMQAQRQQLNESAAEKSEGQR